MSQQVEDTNKKETGHPVSQKETSMSKINFSHSNILFKIENCIGFNLSSDREIMIEEFMNHKKRFNTVLKSEPAELKENEYIDGYLNNKLRHHGEYHIELSPRLLDKNALTSLEKTNTGIYYHGGMIHKRNPNKYIEFSMTIEDFSIEN